MNLILLHHFQLFNNPNATALHSATVLSVFPYYDYCFSLYKWFPYQNIHNKMCKQNVAAIKQYNYKCVRQTYTWNAKYIIYFLQEI